MYGGGVCRPSTLRVPNTLTLNTNVAARLIAPPPPTKTFGLNSVRDPPDGGQGLGGFDYKGIGGSGRAWVGAADAWVGVGITKGSKPSPDHSKITTTTKQFILKTFPSSLHSPPSTIDQV